jgi:hemerythrin-like domain-containing protein
MSTDALVMLRADHKELRRAFRDFQQAGDDAHARKAELARGIIELLTVHTYLENECLYPAVRRLVPDLEPDILESFEEHHVADVLCSELMMMSPEDERFTAKVTVLIESVEHHIEEEEDEWFPKVRDALGRKPLAEIGAQMKEMRPTAPTHPAQPSALKKAIDALVS